MLDSTAPRTPSPQAMWATLGSIGTVVTVAAALLGWAWVAALLGALTALAWVSMRAARVHRSLRSLTRHLENDAPSASLLRMDVDCPETARVARAIQRIFDREAGDRAQVEAELDDLRRTIEVIGHGLIVVDSQHRLLRANRVAELLFRLQPDSWRGRVVEECVREPAVHDLIRQCLKGGEVAPTELRLGDAARVYLAAAEPLRGSQGPQGALLVFDDITRLKRLEALRTDFAANVSHELRTPITSIRGYAETLLGMDSPDPAHVKRFTEIIARNASRLAMLIEDILTLSFLESPAAHRTLECATVSVPAILSGVVETLRPTADARSIAVRITTDPLLTVRANESLVSQALANLVSNAVKYSPVGAEVSVKAASQGDAVCFEVSDTGPGIAAEHIPRLFERFYRVDDARSRELGGTGLGLAIVKHIAKIHGGDVSVTSQVGRGSTFTIRIPRATPVGW